MRKLVLAMASAAALAVPAAASAVTYSFVAEAAFGYGADLTGAFTLETPLPVVLNTIAVPSALDNCSVSYFGVAGVCGFVQVEPHNAGFDVVGFAVSRTAAEIPQTFFYYFDEGAFSRNGTYRSIGVDNVGSLTVAKIAAVPEPGAWALMIAGFGLTGAMLRRRAQAPSPCPDGRRRSEIRA